MTKFLSNLWNDESGISSVEYALLLAFVAAGIIFAASELATAVSNEMFEAAGCISTTTPSQGCYSSRCVPGCRNGGQAAAWFHRESS